MLTVLLIPVRTPAQTLPWVEQFGGPDFTMALTTATDAAGALYVGGSTQGILAGTAGFGDVDAFLAKVDSHGARLWMRQIGTPGADAITDVAVDASGRILVVGVMNGRSAYAGTEGYIAAFDADGHAEWSQPLKIDGSSTVSLTKVAVDVTGNVYALGTAAGDQDAYGFIAHYDLFGNAPQIVPLTDSALAIAAAPGGGSYVASVGQSGQMILRRLDANLSTMWEREHSEVDLNVIPTAVAVTGTGLVYVSGVVDGYDQVAAFVRQYGPTGTLRWARTLTSNGAPPYIRAMTTDTEGNAVVAGFTSSPLPGRPPVRGTFDGFVVTYSTQGHIRSIAQFGTTESEDVMDVATGGGRTFVVGVSLGTFPDRVTTEIGTAFVAQVRGDAPATLRVTTPNTASRWGIGGRQRLAWDYSGNARQFQIEVSRDGGGSWQWVDIIDNRPGTSQSYYWYVSGAATSQARLRVSAIGDTGAVDVNDADIQIADAFIELIRPEPGDRLRTGDVERLFVKHNLGARTPLVFEVSLDGRAWREIGRAPAAGSTTSSFRWPVDVSGPATLWFRARTESGDVVSPTRSTYLVPNDPIH